MLFPSAYTYLTCNLDWTDDVLQANTSLYGIVLVLVYVTLDELLAIGQLRLNLKIVTKRLQKRLQMLAILPDIDRSATLLHGKTGYLGRD